MKYLFRILLGTQSENPWYQSGAFSNEIWPGSDH
jgi:hypothetical protein